MESYVDTHLHCLNSPFRIQIPSRVKKIYLVPQKQVSSFFFLIFGHCSSVFIFSCTTLKCFPDITSNRANSVFFNISGQVFVLGFNVLSQFISEVDVRFIVAFVLLKSVPVQHNVERSTHPVL